MKLYTLFAAVSTGLLLSSCVHNTAKENQLKYTHTTLVDGDAYAIFHKVGETVQSGVEYAEIAEKSADAKSIEIAAKVKSFYEGFLPEFDSLATAFQVDFPIKGVPAVVEHTESAEVVATTDSSEHEGEHAEDDHAHAGAHEHDHGYVSHAQHEISLVKEQLTRLSRNTNKDIQTFAKKHLAVVSELYTAIGGKEEAHAHH